jgi:hypothetical protein
MGGAQAGAAEPALSVAGADDVAKGAVAAAEDVAEIADAAGRDAGATVDEGVAGAPEPPVVVGDELGLGAEFCEPVDPGGAAAAPVVAGDGAGFVAQPLTATTSAMAMSRWGHDLGRRTFLSIPAPESPGLPILPRARRFCAQAPWPSSAPSGTSCTKISRMTPIRISVIVPLRKIALARATTQITGPNAEIWSHRR